MGLSSFLSDGAAIPGQSAIKSMTTQTVLPDWYTNYAMQLLSNQQQQMTTPYAAYQGPRVAEFSPFQQQAWHVHSHRLSPLAPSWIDPLALSSS